MIIRVEFEPHKTPRFPWLVRLCRKFPSYKCQQDGGLEVHSIEFTEKELEKFKAIHEVLYGLPRVAYFIDGELTPKDELFMKVRAITKDQRWDKWIEKTTRNERTRALFHPRPNDEILERLKRHGLFGNPN